MNKSRDVAREFMHRLENDELKKEFLPSQGERLTNESVDEDLKRHRELLKSDFFKEICKM